MPARFTKKVKKQRGSMTHGWGSKKKHRGAGSRGGRGNAGLKKHKKSLMLKLYPDKFGKRGFKIPQKVKRIKEKKAINLKAIDVFAIQNEKKEIDVTEMGFHKVLSTGKLTQALTIKAPVFTEKAKEKITSAGGKFVITGEEVAETPEEPTEEGN